MPGFLRALARNWKLKLLAFALAVLLWVVVSAEQVTSNWIPVPLQVRVDDPQFQLVPSSVPSEVEVRFSGPGRELWDLVVRRPPLVLSVTEVDSTATTFGLEPTMVQVPSQMAVRPMDVRPGAVTLDFFRIDSRLVPVRVRILRGPGDGWTLLDTLDVRPNRIRVSGLERSLRGIEFISTRPISIEAADSAFSRVVELDTAGMEGLRLSAARVRIAGQVDRIRDVNFLQVPVSAGDGVSIRPQEVSVRVRGPESRLQGLTPASFRVAMAIDSIPTRVPPDGVPIPLRVEGMPGWAQVEVVPASVRLFPGRLLLDTVSVPRGVALPDSASAAGARP